MLLPESRAATARRSYDPAGALTITGALVLLVYAVVEAPDAGWASAQTLLLLAGSAALLGVFALIESRHPAPLVPLRILRSRTLVGANAVMLLFATVAFGMPFILTLYAQQVLGYSARQVRADVGRLPRHGRGRLDRRPGRRAAGRLPRRWRRRHGADGRGVAAADTGLGRRQLLRRHLLRRCSSSAPASASRS